jgi:hypothetical protein
MPRVVIAIGGNSLIPDADHTSVQDQYLAAAETDDHIASLVQAGWDVAISHGNGPQVGFILRRSEMASSELHEIPLDYCGADTQGAIGYMLQQNLVNDFRQRGIDKGVATIVTQVEHPPGNINAARQVLVLMFCAGCIIQRPGELFVPANLPGHCRNELFVGSGFHVVSGQERNIFIGETL